MNTGVGREIGAAFARANAQDVEDALRLRYRRAKEIVGSIPSGTADADLTTVQRQALDEYEAAIDALVSLGDDE